MFLKIKERVSLIVDVIVLYFFIGILVRNFNVAMTIIHERGDQWLTADWLINYHFGFVRRGLCGQLIYYLSYLSGFDVVTVTTLIQLILLCLLLAGVCFLYLKTNRGIIEKTLLCSPVFLGFLFWSSRTAFRKELLLIFLFALALVLAFSLAKKKINQITYLFIILIGYIFCGLSHEIIVFYSPFFLFLFYILYKEDMFTKASFLVSCLLVVMINIILLILSYFFHGDASIAKSLCQSLEQNMSANMCEGAVEAIGQNLHEALTSVSNYVLYHGYLLGYGLILLISFIPFCFVLYDKKLKVHLFILVSLFFTIPLYVIAYDWGRWIYTSISLLSLLTFYLLRIKKASIHPMVVKYNYLFILFFFLYVFSWIAPHCCSVNLFDSILVTCFNLLLL